MRTLDQNKTRLYYADVDEKVPVYMCDSEGNVITTEVDGEAVQVIDGYTSEYTAPISFKANISANSGETRIAEYGLNDGDYDAIISANKGEFDFTEQTLIWHTSTPETNSSGYALPESADYRVIAIRTSLNEERFVLKKRVDEE